MFNDFFFLLGFPVIKSVFGRLCRKTVPPGEERHEGLVPRNDFLTNGFIGFSLARTLAQIRFVPRLRPPRNPEGVANLKKAICVVRSDSIIAVTFITHLLSLLLLELKSVDDVGSGKLREMLTLHTNPHAVHGRFTPQAAQT